MKKSSSGIFTIILLIIFCILFGLYLTYFKYTGFWYDESFTGIVVKNDWHDMISIVVNDVHPPLYYVLLKIRSSIVGVTNQTLRLFSLFMFVASLILIYSFSKLGTDNYKFASLLTLVLCINPFLFQYALEVRQYSLFLFFIICSIYFFYKALQESSFKIGKNYILFGLFLGLALLTQYAALFIALSFGLYILFVLIKKQGLKKFFCIKNLLFVLQVFAIPILFVLLIIPLFYYQYIHNNSLAWINQAELYYFAKMIVVFFVGYNFNININNSIDYKFVIGGFVIIFLIIMLVIFFYKKLSKKCQDFFVLNCFIGFIPVLTIFVLSYFLNMNYFIERYFLYTAVFFFICLFLLLSRLSNKIYQVLLGLYIVLCLGINLFRPYLNNHFQDIPKLAADSVGYIVFLNEFDYTNGLYVFDKKDWGKVKLYNIDNPNKDFSLHPYIKEDLIIREFSEIPDDSIFISNSRLDQEKYDLITEHYDINFYNKKN